MGWRKKCFCHPATSGVHIPLRTTLAIYLRLSGMVEHTPDRPRFHSTCMPPISHLEKECRDTRRILSPEMATVSCPLSTAGYRYRTLRNFSSHPETGKSRRLTKNQHTYGEYRQTELLQPFRNRPLA